MAKRQKTTSSAPSTTKTQKPAKAANKKSPPAAAKTKTATKAPPAKTTTSLATTSFLDQVLEKRIWGNITILHLFFSIILIIALITRGWDLGYKALHHDESMHAIYSHYFHEGLREGLRNFGEVLTLQRPLLAMDDIFPSQEANTIGENTPPPTSFFSWYVNKGLRYDFNPMMHGPFLYHSQGLTYFAAGMATYFFRLPPLLMLVYLLFVLGGIWLFFPKSAKNLLNKLSPGPELQPETQPESSPDGQTTRLMQSTWGKIISILTLLVVDTLVLIVLLFRFTDFATNDLAGVTEYTSRLAPAILGVGLVLIPFLFQKYLTRTGAVIASLMLLISPTSLYIGRFQREDIYLAVPTLLAFLCFFHYLRTHTHKWAYATAAFIAWMYCTKAVFAMLYYIMAFFAISVIATELWKYFTEKRQTLTKSTTPFSPFSAYLKNQIKKLWGHYTLAFLVITSYLYGFYHFFFGKWAQGLAEDAPSLHATLYNLFHDGATTNTLPVLLTSTITALILLLIIFILSSFASWLHTTQSHAWQDKPLINAFLALLGNTKVVTLSFSILMGIILVLYSTLISNPLGIFQALPYPADTRTNIGYWFSQQDVQRGAQNWKYYLTLLFPYEIFPVIFGLIGIGCIAYRLGKEKYHIGWSFAGTLTFTFILLEILDFKHIAHYKELQANGALSDPGLLQLREDTVWGLIIYFAFFLIIYFVPFLMGWGNEKAASEARQETAASTWHRLFQFFLVNWFILLFLFLSWAGEKMPWLNLHLTIPLIFLSSFVLKKLIARLYSLLGKSIPAALLLTGGIAVSIVFLMFPSLAAYPTVWILPVFAIGSGIAFIGIQEAFPATTRTIAVAFLLVCSTLTTYSIVSAARVSYLLPDDPTELLVYTQSTQGTKRVNEYIRDLAAKLPEGEEIHVNIEDSQSWPFVWYLRGLPNLGYPTTITSLPEPPHHVILLGKEEWDQTKDLLKGIYVGMPYKLRWWWIINMDNWKSETTTGQAIRFTDYLRYWTSPKLWNWLLTREPWLSPWQEENTPDADPRGAVDAFFLVRKDVAPLLWKDGIPPNAVEELLEPAEPEDPPYDQDKSISATFITEWGEEGTAPGQFNDPKSFAFGKDNSIYVVDRYNHRIQKFSETGEHLQTIGSFGQAPGQFDRPNGAALDEEGNLYVTDTWNHRIQKFSSDGTFLSTFGIPGQSGQVIEELWGPRGIAIANETIYITDTGNKQIKIFDLTGTPLAAWGGAGRTEGKLNEPIGIVATEDAVYVGDTWNQRIQKFDLDGNAVLSWDIIGWEGEHNNNEPYLALDSDGNIWTPDPFGNRILSFTTDGEFRGQFGKKGTGRLEFTKPNGVGFDNNGYLYITDSENHRIQKIQVN